MAKGLQRAGPASLARRHFVAAASAAAARGITLGGMATLLQSSADAAPKKRKKDRPQCFLKGTHILVSGGEAKVEELKVGDLVRTVRGELKPIRWIGHRTYKRHRNRWNDDVLPICVARGALSDGTPYRDLGSISGALSPSRRIADACRRVGQWHLHRTAVSATLDVIEVFSSGSRYPRGDFSRRCRCRNSLRSRQRA